VMANQVYANNMEVSCKAASGKTICNFPDVCMTPPQTRRDLDRALGMLVRKGYGLELAHDALRRHHGVSGDPLD